MNLRKYLSITLLTLVLLSQAGSALAQSQTPAATESTPKVISDCNKMEPKYLTEDKIDLSKPYAGQYELNFRIAFEDASNKYHLYMECVFEGIVKTMLGSAGGDTSGIFAANAPDMPEFMKPDAACLKEDQLSTVLKSGSPETLLQPLLATYNTYVNYLRLIEKEARKNVSIVHSDGTARSIAEISASRLYMTTLVGNEIDDALAALDSALNGLKEMRKAFMMHVHFQCMLKNLELYRHAMENLRRIISILPSVIENASMH